MGGGGGVRDWWLIMTTPAGHRCWQLGDPDETAKAELVVRARVLAGFPNGDEWTKDHSFSVLLTEGVPHPNLLAAATVGRIADLQAVPPGQVTAYLAEYDRLGQAAKVAHAEKALSALDDATVDAIVARRKASRPSGGAR